MQLKECYESFGGNYEDVRSRLIKDELIHRLVIKFLADASYKRLSEAMEQADYSEAFRAVHTLKGVSQNLSFDCLSRSADALTEALRRCESEPVDEAECAELFRQVSADYEAVTAAIRMLQQSDTPDD